MDENIRKLQEERNQLFSDYYNNITPKRMPVTFGIHAFIAAQLKGIDITKLQFDYSLLADVADEISQSFYSDTCPFRPIGMNSRIPGCYQAIDSQSFRMGNNGYMQHPEVEGMLFDEYDELTADPYACILEKVLPRQHKALDAQNGIMRSISIDLLRHEDSRQRELSTPYSKALMEKYGYYTGSPRGSGGFTSAPYDFLADQLRGFSKISADIRRNRQKIADSCEALLPLMFRLGMPDSPHPEGSVGMPLHMPPYMREKDFAEIWLPSFLKLVEQFAVRGARLSAFCENDWMRYLDYLQEFPAGTVLKFEYGDPKTIKDKLGSKINISGLFPVLLMRTGSKQEILDKAKEILDIMLPGCGYIMDFDKNPLSVNDINMENYKAFTEFLRDYAVYDNPTAPFGTKLNSENFAVDDSIGNMDSKYFIDWDEYKSKYPATPESYHRVLSEYNNKMLKFYLGLLV